MNKQVQFQQAQGTERVQISSTTIETEPSQTAVSPTPTRQRAISNRIVRHML